MTKIIKKINTYQVSKDGEYATFIVNEGNTDINIICSSSYGTFSYYWSNTGVNPKEFLNKIKIDYTLSKFNVNYQAIDHKKQLQVFLKDLELYVSENNLDSDTEEDLTVEANELAGSIMIVNNEHNLYELTEHYDFLRTVYGTDNISDIKICSIINPGWQFFWDELWNPFVKYLLTEYTLNNSFSIGDLVEINDSKYLGIRLYIVSNNNNYYQLSHILNESNQFLIEYQADKLLKVNN